MLVSRVLAVKVEKLTSGWNWTPQRGFSRCRRAMISSRPELLVHPIASNTSGRVSASATRLLYCTDSYICGIPSNRPVPECRMRETCPCRGAAAFTTCSALHQSLTRSAGRCPLTCPPYVIARPCRPKQSPKMGRTCPYSSMSRLGHEKSATLCGDPGPGPRMTQDIYGKYSIVNDSLRARR
jgi:hypothetical protein